MNSDYHLPRSGWLTLLGPFLAVLPLVACGTASVSIDSDAGGAAAIGGMVPLGGGGGMTAQAGSGGTIAQAGSGRRVPVAGQDGAGSGGSAPVAGPGGTGNSGGGQTDDCVPQEIKVPPPNCAGLSGYDLTVCYKIAKGELPATCQGKCGADKDQCCAQVREEHLELANYPECDQGPFCPQVVLDQLKNNPYGNNISEECGTCICESCNKQINYVHDHGQSSITMLQCGLGNLVNRDCYVCNPPPCDTQLGTNLMTGPCSQEVLAACGGQGCNCAGPFDLNCLSLATCLDKKTAFSFPCSAAHSTTECIMANCPACPPLVPCPSQLTR